MSTMVPLKDGSLVGVAALLFQMTLSLMILYKITEDCGVRASTLAPIASFGRERGSLVASRARPREKEAGKCIASNLERWVR
jgi:cobalamin synthase